MDCVTTSSGWKFQINNVAVEGLGGNVRKKLYTIIQIQTDWIVHGRRNLYCCISTGLIMSRGHRGNLTYMLLSIIHKICHMRVIFTHLKLWVADNIRLTTNLDVSNFTTRDAPINKFHLSAPHIDWCQCQSGEGLVFLVGILFIPYNAEICLYKPWRPKRFFNLKSL